MYIRFMLPLGLLAVIVLTSSVACNLDPWVTRSNAKDTDIVTITKTTKYGVSADGKSPYKGQVGAVKMSHSVHENLGLKCIDCHHKEGNDARIKQCAVCHTGKEGFDTMHGLCLDCHIGRNEGPQECMGCH